MRRINSTTEEMISALEVLKCYVSEAEPHINKQLRTNSADPHEVALFDSLFTDNPHPEYLYRWLPSCYVKNNDGILTDKGYLSCSDNPCSFIDHVFGEDLACYMINTYKELKTIDVQALLQNYNNEGEFILPRELVLEVTSDKLYQESKFALFLNDIKCYDINDKGLKDIYQIKSIRLINARIKANEC